MWLQQIERGYWRAEGSSGGGGGMVSPMWERGRQDLWLTNTQPTKFTTIVIIVTQLSKSKHLKACLGPALVANLDQRGPPLPLC